MANLAEAIKTLGEEQQRKMWHDRVFVLWIWMRKRKIHQDVSDR